MNAILNAWTERLRRRLLAGVEADIARLERELEAQRAALSDPERLRPLLGSAIGDAAGHSPEALAAALRPIVEELVRQPQRAAASRRRRGWASVGAATVVVLVAGAAFPRSTALAPARIESGAPRRTPDSPAVRLEETDAGFGLGQSGVSDEDLARAVRDRLEGRPELAGTRLRFAVKEGWVWLRGQADEATRRAAGEALADLGEEVVVVNQIDADRDRELVARPGQP